MVEKDEYEYCIMKGVKKNSIEKGGVFHFVCFADTRTFLSPLIRNTLTNYLTISKEECDASLRARVSSVVK